MLGAAEGDELGAVDGGVLGTSEAVTVGFELGDSDVRLDGDTVGSDEGNALAASDGWFEGSAEDLLDTLGEPDSSSDGLIEGDAVGKAEGDMMRLAEVALLCASNGDGVGIELGSLKLKGELLC